MYRDPSEFRDRFKAYKEGKSVREIYGLPGYAGGSLPIDEMMPYILAVENPTRQGLVNGIWRPPTDSSKWDTHAIGGGLDIREEHNPIVYNYLKSHGRLNNPYLTEKEEANLRQTVFTKTMLPALQKMYNKYGGKISAKGYARLAGMKWQGHPFLMAISPDSVTGKAFLKAIESGDKDLDSVFDAYYRYPANAKRYSARIQADTDYWKSHIPSGSLQEQIINVGKTQPERIIAMPDATRVATIPTVKQQTVPSTWMQQATELPNYTLEQNFELNKPLNIQRLVDAIDAYTPTWEGLKQSYSNGKLPGYQGGLTPEQKRIQDQIVQNQGTIQQGHRWSPLSNYANSTWRDYNKPFFQQFIEGGLGNAARGLQQQLESWNKEVRGIADITDHANVLLDILTGAGGKITKNSSKELINNTKKAVKNAIKPTKASIKKSTMSAPEVAKYHKTNPKLVKPVQVTPELQKAVDYTYDRANRLSKEPIEKVDLNMHSAKFPENTKVSAYATPYGTVFDEAYINEMQKMGIMVPHEYEHLLQQQIKYTPEQASILEQAFPFSSDWLAAHRDFDLLKERGAMNSELAYAIGKKYGFPVGKQFDNVVRNMSSNELEEIASQLSAYNKHSNEQRLARANIWPDLIPEKPGWNPLIQALTKVPATITVPLLAVDQTNEYKDGKLPGYSNGKIRIKPANRGKFNATKKRTGKTTEELTHSKNPLTRKRAIFAQNARKWNHK